MFIVEKTYILYMGKSGMAKLSQAIEKVENYFINRKDRKQALKQAKTEYKDLVNAIKQSETPSDFLNSDDIPTQ